MVDRIAHIAIPGLCDHGEGFDARDDAIDRLFDPIRAWLKAEIMARAKDPALAQRVQLAMVTADGAPDWWAHVVASQILYEAACQLATEGGDIPTLSLMACIHDTALSRFLPERISLSFMGAHVKAPRQ